MNNKRNCEQNEEWQREWAQKEREEIGMHFASRYSAVAGRDSGEGRGKEGNDTRNAVCEEY